MSFLYILLIAFLTFACSDNIEKNTVTKEDSSSIEKNSVHSKNIQSKSFTEENISGNSASRISGTPSSSNHLSGQ